MATLLSKKCQYALHALAYMAERNDLTVQVVEICKSKNIPRKFLESILLELRKSGILGSRQGKGGGFFLKRNPNSISLLEIIHLVDGVVAMLPCVALHNFTPCETCPDEGHCHFKRIFSTVRDSTFKILSQTYIADLVNKGSFIELLDQK
jgi:Rrf2 family protein